MKIAWKIFERGIFFTTIIVFSFLLSACGQTPPTSSSNVSETTAGNAFDKGKIIYSKTCVTCHLANGKGVENIFPPLEKSDFLAEGKTKAITQVIKGRVGEIKVNGISYNNIMPPQGLDDSDIADVLTYVYASFGNAGLKITPEDVKSVRATLK